MNDLTYKLGARMSYGEQSKDTMTGKIKKWFEEKGYGFINSDGKDYFTHITKIKDNKAPPVGADVSFRTVESMKGIQAIDVEIMN